MPGAKPQAEIRYKLISGGNEELTRLLEQLTGTEEAMLNLNPNRNYNNAQIKCEVHHETIMQDADYETLWTRTITLDVRNWVQMWSPVISLFFGFILPISIYLLAHAESC